MRVIDRAVCSSVLMIGLAGCAGVPPTPTQAVGLLAPSLHGKFACYLVPSAYYVPGTVIRIEKDPDNPGRPKPGAEPIVSIKSPIKIVESEKFAEIWSINWEDKTVDGSITVKLLSAAFQLTKDSEAKLKGSRGVRMEAKMENVRELLLYDEARKQVQKEFQNHLDEIQPNYLYFWIKGALLPERIHFLVKPSNGFEFNVPIARTPASLELHLKSSKSGTGEIVAGGVINCIHPQSVEIKKTDMFIGPPDVEIIFRDLRSPAETPFGRVPQR